MKLYKADWCWALEMPVYTEKIKGVFYAESLWKLILTAIAYKWRMRKHALTDWTR